jgi:hypothetical protein
MTHSESIAAIGAALAKAQGEMDNATKDSKNPHFNSKYADLAAVVGACREALAKHGISVVQSPNTFDGNLVRLKTLLLHSSGEWIESDELQVQARDAGPQAIGSCLTYLRRYQLSAMVGIAPEDDDAEAAEGRILGTGKAVAPRVPVSTKPGEKRTWTPGPNTTTNAATAVLEPPPLTDKDIAF